MGNIRFKSCVSCSNKRAWHLEECPSCGETEFDISSGDSEKLLQDAIGDSVSELVLFETEAPLLNLSERGRISNIIPGRVQERVEGVTVDILNSPVCDYLNPGEQPHFVLKAHGSIQRETAQEVSTIDTSDDFDASRIVVTDERTIFLIGQEKGDVVKSCPHSAIVNADSTSGLLRTNLSIESEDVSYEISDCQPYDEVAPVVAYIRAQASTDRGSNSEWDEEDYQQAKGATRDERAKKAFENVDILEAIGYGATGAKFGSRIGPKGTAIGFAIGTGIGIWNDLSQGTGTTEAPDPDQVARDIKKWQQSGAKTGDEKVEWLAASTGVAVSIASQNSNDRIEELLESVDPEDIVTVLELGSTTLEETSGKIVPSNSKLDTLPPIETLRQPVEEIASIVSELQEEGLFEELVE